MNLSFGILKLRTGCYLPVKLCSACGPVRFFSENAKILTKDPVKLKPSEAYFQKVQVIDSLFLSKIVSQTFYISRQKSFPKMSIKLLLSISSTVFTIDCHLTACRQSLLAKVFLASLYLERQSPQESPRVFTFGVQLEEERLC
jgi:hypothetical protein